MELSSGTPRYPIQLPRLIPFKNQLNLNKNLIGTEPRHSKPSLQLPRQISFRNERHFNKILIGTELRHSQISSTTAETDSLSKSIEF